jgi:AraC-like DNA-binding protein
VRSVEGIDAVLDPTLAYFLHPGVEQHFEHPHEGGDDCTMFELDDALARSLTGEESLPHGPVVPTSARLDLTHRLLLRDSERHDDAEALHERALMLVAATVDAARPSPVAPGRATTARARRALADGARELLAEDPDRSLLDLAEALAVSPHHLSRIFRADTGRTVSRHRMRLRTRAALERLAGGEQDLVRIAAEAGFADQSHLCRVVRREAGTTPGALRAALSSAERR